ncbi:MAG: DUF1059 domain-containing protein, partial [Nitrospirae bacterium]
MAFEFKCNKLGNRGCKWKAISNTEDKLVDLVAVHMRDEHDVKDFTQEMIAEVKQKMSEVSLKGEGDIPEMKEYRCPECNWRYLAQTENLIADAAALHARDVHGVKEFTEEMIAEV